MNGFMYECDSGEHSDFGDHVFMPNDSVLFGLTMRAPTSVSEDVDKDGELKTYNNIYR